MLERQRRSLSTLGFVIYILGIGLGIWAIASRYGEVNIGSNAWSPDGQRLVFTWNNTLYTVNIAGTNLYQLSPMSGFYSEPAWSPTGDQIVYMFRRNRSDKYALWIMDAAGQNAKRALPAESLDEFYPHWSPDSKRLGLYRALFYGGDPYDYGHPYFILTDFNHVYRQPENLRITDEMKWSPDSKKVAFVGFIERSWNIYSVAADGTNLQQLTNGSNDKSPVWSPDGTQLAFYSERDTQQNRSGSIYILYLPSQNIKRITGIVDRAERMEWSPNGKKIALATYHHPPDQSDLYLMNADGTDLHIIDTAIRGLISWSPDGQFLAFTASNFLIVLDANNDKIILKYHPRLFEQLFFFLPIPFAEAIAVIALLLGPLFTVPSASVQFLDIRRPVLRCCRAAIQVYATFGGYTIGFGLLVGCVIILSFVVCTLS